MNQNVIPSEYRYFRDTSHLVSEAEMLGLRLSQVDRLKVPEVRRFLTRCDEVLMGYKDRASALILLAYLAGRRLPVRQSFYPAMKKVLESEASFEEVYSFIVAVMSYHMFYGAGGR